MLTIEIKMNGRVIGGAKVRNVSGLANFSDYEVEAAEAGSTVTRLGDFHAEFPVVGHHRRQTVWALVKKVAAGVLLERSVRNHPANPSAEGGET